MYASKVFPEAGPFAPSALARFELEPSSVGALRVGTDFFAFGAAAGGALAERPARGSRAGDSRPGGGGGVVAVDVRLIISSS